MRRRIVNGCLYPIAFMLFLIAVAIAFVAFQGRRTPGGNPEYVALGSSFAAGAGLGPLQQGSPVLCARSTGGYPQRLARGLDLPIVDMSCGGAVTANVLYGGQFFQGAQIRVIDKATRLATITVGGNDVNFVGDLSMLALRKADGLGGWLARRLWNGPRGEAARGYERLGHELAETIRAIRTRAPKAIIVVATYPAILPPQGTCPQLRLSEEEADLMRPIERRLAAVTRAAALRNGAILVDMNALGAGHNACSAKPWTRGWAPLMQAPFHPTATGAQATADAIAAALAHQ